MLISCPRCTAPPTPPHELGRLDIEELLGPPYVMDKCTETEGQFLFVFGVYYNTLYVTSLLHET